MLKREWGEENSGKLPHLLIPGKTATLVPTFAVEDLPLDRTAALVPEIAVNTLMITPRYLKFYTFSIDKFLVTMFRTTFDGVVCPYI